MEEMFFLVSRRRISLPDREDFETLLFHRVPVVRLAKCMFFVGKTNRSVMASFLDATSIVYFTKTLLTLSVFEGDGSTCSRSLYCTEKRSAQQQQSFLAQVVERPLFFCLL